MKNENFKLEGDQFDYINPFNVSGIDRIEALRAGMTDAQIMAFFLRNFSCYLYYRCDIESHNHAVDDSPSKLLYKIIFDKTYENFFSYNKLEEFANEELLFYTKENYPEAMHYVHFIISNWGCIKIIDQLYSVNLCISNMIDSSYENYVKTLNLPTSTIELFEIDDAFELIGTNILKEIYHSLLFEINYSLCDFESAKEGLDTIIFHLNNRLLNEPQKKQFQESALLWFEQFLDTLCFQLKITEHPAFINQIKHYFSAKLPLATLQDTPDYPKVIFSSYQGYHLFDTLAKGLSTKVVISFVYRFLYEQGHILVKDTPFRTWYNTQQYAIQLTTATETLQNSKSVDREQFVRLLANLLDVDL